MGRIKLISNWNEKNFKLRFNPIILWQKGLCLLVSLWSWVKIIHDNHTYVILPLFYVKAWYLFRKWFIVFFLYS